MNQDNQPIKFFVNSQNKATIRCPGCGVSKTVNVSNIEKPAQRFKITCKCGETFRGIIEFRKYYRKPVRLPGQYIHLNKPRRGDMVVKDISMGGVALSCGPNHGLKPGDNLEIMFELDDAKRSNIRMKVTVRNIKGDVVGTERTDGQTYQSALGFYLM